MKRFWEKTINSRGSERFFRLPFLIFLNIITPPYQFFLRKHLAKRQRSRSREWKAKVISIGNITVGGSGKTPITIFLAELLKAKGKTPAIVHSGYGRRDRREYIIEAGQISDYSVAQVGDEVLMMGERLPWAGFAVGSHKKRMVRIADERLRPDIILIDDGYQRLDIEKDLDIAIVSSELMAAAGEKGRLTGRLFPRGILREPVRALERADLIFVIREDCRESDYRELPGSFNSRAEVLSWTMSLTGVESDGRIEDITVLNSRRPFVFASIGSYSRMLRMLKKSGLSIASDWNFGDHHAYTDKDFRRLKKLSDRYSADCYLTTAKDMVKLPPESLDKPVYCLRLAIRPDEGESLDDIMDMTIS